MTSLAIASARTTDAVFEGTSAASDSGQVVLEELRRICEASKARASNWLGGVDASIDALAHECGSADWDGYNAAPIKATALENAHKVAAALYSLLPTGVPSPDVVPERDGDITLSWTRDRQRGFSLSISDHDRVSFAGVLEQGAERYGGETFDGSNPRVLQEVSRYISRLYGL